MAERRDSCHSQRWARTGRDGVQGTVTCLGKQERTGEVFVDQTTEQELAPARGWRRENRKRAVTGRG